MGSQAPASSDRTRTNWTPTMERYFIDLMLDQMHRGNRLGHTFNKQAWTDMLTIFNAKFGCKYDRDTLKSHYTILWKQYNDVKNLLDQNGFAWDDTRKILVASPHVWDAYIKAQPDAQVYRNKILTNFNDLCLIYAYTQADGRYSRSSHDIDFDDETQGVNFGVGAGSISPASPEHSKIVWTPAMERYFIELMLDQLKKGNKETEKFNKHAWKEMLNSFNTKFCSHYGKSFLIRRYKKLSKYYGDIRSLLQQKGFSWDEKLQMIRADDYVWDNYVEVHPEACTYRKKKLLNYKDLWLIFGSSSNNHFQSHKSQGRKTKPNISSKTGGKHKGHPFDRSNLLSIQWTPEMDCYLIDLLLDQALRGNKINHAFMPEAWTDMLTMFNSHFSCHYDKYALKNCSRLLRRQYNEIKGLLEQKGFSWDDTREMVTADDHVWDSQMKVHPYAQSYRNKAVPNYPKLCVIYGEESSDGLCSGVAQHVYLEYDDPDLMTGCDTEFHANINFGCSRTDWTPLMDRHLIDLLLEQVHKGNKIKYTVNSEAWMEMAVSFMERFGLRQDVDLLRNHHKSLGKLYNEMKNLLDHRGFSWDETRQMVTAHSDVWDAYIKEHPDAEPYRNESKPNYNDLCLIFGNSTSDGKCNRSDPNARWNGAGTKFNNGYCWRTDWTPPMDRYLIDLMLEHVRQGNTVHKKFKKYAWGDMVTKFSAEFGHQYNKDVLKSRFINLRKRFSDMKSLLEQSGFSWNETRQMIVADDILWDAYVKEHPDARSYRNRTLPSYNDLLFIYGNSYPIEDHLDTENEPCKEDDEPPASSSPVGIPGSRSIVVKAEIDNDAMDMGFHEIFGELQSLVSEFEISDLRKKRKPPASSVSSLPRKAQRTSLEIQGASDETPRTAKTLLDNEEGISCSSIESIVDALQAVPGMDDELFLEASKLLEDENNAKMFVAMDANQRRKWLLRKLHR